MKTVGPMAGLCAAFLFLTGCGTEDGDRVHVKGTVSLEGRPVSMGVIYFNPDINRKNSGPQGIAEIKNGTFDTKQDGKGGPPGAAIILVEAFDGKGDEERPKGNALFVYEKQVELSRDMGPLDLNLKKSDVKKPGAATGVHIGP